MISNKLSKRRLGLKPNFQKGRPKIFRRPKPLQTITSSHFLQDNGSLS